MQRGYNLAHFILAGVVVLGLTPLMVVVDAQARIAFVSDRDGHIINNFFAYEIYVMDNDGDNQRNLTNNPHDDTDPAWSNPVLAVAPAGKILTMWGRLKQVNQ